MKFRIGRALARCAIGALVAATGARPALAGTVSGTLPQPGVVWVSDGSDPAAMPESIMRNAGKAFVPDLLIVTVGSSVRFPNDDDFFHSIFSSSQSDPFDVGFYDTGPGKVIAFPKPGVDVIRCHIHGAMRATILVVDGPWVRTDRPGEAYRIDGVRAGRHVLHAWTPDGGERTSDVVVRDR